MLRGFIRYHSADGGGGTGTNQQQSTGTDSGSDQWQLPQAAQGGFQRALDQRYNQDSLLFAQRLYDENYTLRRRVDELKGRVPAEGTTVLTSDEAKLWADYKALGVPTDVKQQIEQGQSAITERDGLKRSQTIRDAADAAGYKPSVLTTLADKDKLAVSVRETNGTREAVVIVEGQQPVPLTEYAQQHWADFLLALTAQSQTQQSTGIPYVQQVSNGKKQEQLTAGQSYLKNTYKQKEAK